MKLEFLTQKQLFVLILFIIFCFFAVAYQHFVVIPKEVLNRQQQREREIEARELRIQRAYEDCKELAYVNYENNWSVACEALGKKKDCNLPSYRAEELDQQLKEAQTRTCVTISQQTK